MVPLGNVTIRLHQRGMNSLLNSRRGPIYGMVQRETRQTERLAKQNVGRRSGQLRRSIGNEMSVAPFVHVKGRVYTRESYGLFVEVGTRSPIVPRRSAFLRFRSTRASDRGRLYVVRQVSGQPGQRYLTLGLLEAVRTRDYTVNVLLGAPYSGVSSIA